jgi:hypothetical protein
MPESEDRRRAFLELRRNAEALKFEGAKSFEQAMLMLSAGAFALSKRLKK